MSGADTVSKWAESLRVFGKDWPPEGADACRRVIERQIALDTGGDSRLSNHPAGAIEVRIEGDGSEWSVLPDGNMGALGILENGTGPHTIRPRGAGRAVLTPAGPRRMVHVEGVAARHTWSKGAEQGIKEAERTAEAAFGEVDK